MVKMELHQLLAIVAILAMSSSFVIASDPSPLQDFCVAVNNPVDGLLVNGKFCKNPNMVNADDFLFRGLQNPGNTSNQLGSEVTRITEVRLPGLNTLGISIARIDFAPYGLNAPHTHPRATEIILVLEGTLYAGFVASNQNNNTFFTKVLSKGDVFVFPQGMIHFVLNVGKTNALAFSSFSSQNPGVITIANAVFGSRPPISLDVLTKAFQVDKDVIQYLQAQFC